MRRLMYYIAVASSNSVANITACRDSVLPLTHPERLSLEPVVLSPMSCGCSPVHPHSRPQPLTAILIVRGAYSQRVMTEQVRSVTNSIRVAVDRCPAMPLPATTVFRLFCVTPKYR
ncbi:hypothetical protein CA85_50200 [Allorhodopirellula solitaria]|uniref:Uncharacterized protein n=1 Tax=Allorhodopirellula solitaria TaxID=2527987 RepID=A0A5C5WNG1_9BACT|nr:hypothetical protein CA85_50200 [Allorhodopirellula solitaria]